MEYIITYLLVADSTEYMSYLLITMAITMALMSVWLKLDLGGRLYWLKEYLRRMVGSARMRRAARKELILLDLSFEGAFSEDAEYDSYGLGVHYYGTPGDVWAWDMNVYDEG